MEEPEPSRSLIEFAYRPSGLPTVSGEPDGSYAVTWRVVDDARVQVVEIILSLEALRELVTQAIEAQAFAAAAVGT